MTGDIFLALFIAIPIVVLTAAFVYHMALRRDDMDKMDRYKQSMHDDEPRPPRDHPERVH
jgi:hypothetical protein